MGKKGARGLVGEDGGAAMLGGAAGGERGADVGAGAGAGAAAAAAAAGAAVGACSPQRPLLRAGPHADHRGPGLSAPRERH